MKFVVKKEDLFNGIKIVERATSVKALQPIFSNIYIENVGNNKIKLIATDLDLTIIAQIDAQIEEDGKITIPAKILNEIVSKLENKLIKFEVEEGSATINVSCQNTKFDILGINANEFPIDVCNVEVNEEEGFEIELSPFTKAVRKAGFAAASYETSNLLSGIVCDISGESLEIASTDGNRLTRIKENIKNKDNKVTNLIIPAKTLNEFVQISSYIDEDSIKIYAEKSKLVIKSEKAMIISRLLEGKYPNYNKLIPTNCPKEAIVNVSKLINAIERVSIVASDKTNTIKMNFEDNTLMLQADSAETGKSNETIDIKYTSEPIVIAFNYKYVLPALKNIDSEEVIIGMNTSLSATLLKPNNEEDFICLVMPVQIR